MELRLLTTLESWLATTLELTHGFDISIFFPCLDTRDMYQTLPLQVLATSRSYDRLDIPVEQALKVLEALVFYLFDLILVPLTVETTF